LIGERLDMAVINGADDAAATRLILPFVERAPELAARIARRRPFDRPAALSEAVRMEIVDLGEDDLIAFFRNHPELAPSRPDDMTDASQKEQARLALTALSPSDAERLANLNRRYAQRFDFPFIIALHRHSDIASVLAAFETRLTASRDAEIATARDEIISVSGARIGAAFGMAEVTAP
jgi:OHCU decarboxylase